MSTYERGVRDAAQVILRRVEQNRRDARPVREHQAILADVIRLIYAEGRPLQGRDPRDDALWPRGM